MILLTPRLPIALTKRCKTQGFQLDPPCHVVLDASVGVDGPSLIEVRPAVATGLCVVARFEKVNN